MTEPRQQAGFDADECEWDAVRGGASASTSGLSDEVAAGVVDLLDEDSSSKDIITRDLQSDARNGEAIRVAELRRDLLSPAIYPFDLTGGGFRYDRKENILYEFFLVTSLAAGNPKRNSQRYVQHFERLAYHILRAFVGSDAVGVRNGWPSDTTYPDDDAPNVKGRARLEALHRRCRFHADEMIPHPKPARRRRTDDSNDARLDVVIRRPLGDDRIGALTLFAQCGCGQSDVVSASRKHYEIHPGYLETILAELPVPPPMIAFATPQHMVEHTDLRDKQQEARCLIFDRIRLLRLAKPGVIPAPLLERAAQLTANFSDELKTLKKAGRNGAKKRRGNRVANRSVPHRK